MGNPQKFVAGAAEMKIWVEPHTGLHQLIPDATESQGQNDKRIISWQHGRPFPPHPSTLTETRTNLQLMLRLQKTSHHER